MELTYIRKEFNPDTFTPQIILELKLDLGILTDNFFNLKEIYKDLITHEFYDRLEAILKEIL